MSGADTPFTVNELARTGIAVSAQWASNPGVRSPRGARNEVQIAFSDHGKCRTVFGERAAKPLSDGIQTMAAFWVKSHGARVSG